MDRISDSDSEDAGSIPAEATNGKKPEIVKDFRLFWFEVISFSLSDL